MSTVVRRCIIVSALIMPILTMSPAYAANCGSDQAIDKTLPGGSRWEICWRVDGNHGLVFSNIVFTTETGVRRRILRNASLGQLSVHLNDGSASWAHVTREGLGNNLIALNNSRCNGGLLHSDGSRNLICETTRARGYAWKYYTLSRQGHELNLASLFQLPTGNYAMQWAFHDDGTIVPSMGHAGDLQYAGSNSRYGWQVGTSNTQNVIAKAFTIDYIWKLEFGLGDDARDDVFEMMEVVPDSSRSKKYLNIQTVSTEQAWKFNPGNKRSWRVKDSAEVNADGHAVSYHLEPVSTGRIYRDAAKAWTNNDVFLTRDNSCERFGTDNPGNCGRAVDQFVNQQSVQGARTVLWYRTSYHRLPREEDRDGFHLGESSFRLTPRDWTATSSLGQ